MMQYLAGGHPNAVEHEDSVLFPKWPKRPMPEKAAEAELDEQKALQITWHNLEEEMRCSGYLLLPKVSNPDSVVTYADRKKMLDNKVEGVRTLQDEEVDFSEGFPQELLTGLEHLTGPVNVASNVEHKKIVRKTGKKTKFSDLLFKDPKKSRKRAKIDLGSPTVLDGDMDSDDGEAKQEEEDEEDDDAGGDYGEMYEDDDEDGHDGLADGKDEATL